MKKILRGRRHKSVCMAVMNDLTRDPRVLKEARTLARLGWHVKIIAYMSEATKDRARESLGNIEIIRIGLMGGEHERNRLMALLEFYGPLFRYGTRMHENLYKEAIGDRFDIYHAHDLDTLRPMFRAARYHNSRCIYDSHELYLEVLRENVASEQKLVHKILHLVLFVYYSLVERIVIGRVDRVITVSESIADYLAGTYSIKKPTVLKNCPSYHPLDKRNNINLFLPAHRYLVLYQGWFQKERNVPAIVESIKFLPSTYHLLLLGDGPEKKKVTKAIENNRLDSRVTVTKVAPEELTSIVPQATIGLVPLQPLSLNEKYALPNKLFEYMMAGVPVVASDMPEVAKIINQEKIGATFNSFEPREIAQAIRKVVESPRYEQMRRNALKAAREKYNWEQEEPKLLTLYENLLRK